MVKILSPKDLKGMNSEELADHIKSMRKDSKYKNAIDMKSLIAEAELLDETSEIEDFLRGKISTFQKSGTSVKAKVLASLSEEEEEPSTKKKTLKKLSVEEDDDKCEKKKTPPVSPRSRSGSGLKEEEIPDWATDKDKEKARSLLKINVRNSKKGATQDGTLLGMAKELNIPQRNKLSKEPLIWMIIQKQKSGVKKSPPPSPKRPKAKPVEVEELVEEPVEEVEEPVEEVEEPVEEVEEPVEEVEEPEPEESSEEQMESDTKGAIDNFVEKIRKKPSTKCGSEEYDALLGKGLTDLRRLLGEKKIGNTSEVQSSEHAAGLLCSLNRGNKTCDENTPCDKDKICDITTKPGVCVDKEFGWDKPEFLIYKDKYIVGSHKAINALNKKLGLNLARKPYYGENFEDRLNHRLLMKRAIEISGKEESYFQYMSPLQIRNFIEGFIISEKRSKSTLISKLKKENQKFADFDNLSIEDLKNKIRKMSPYVPEDMPREQLIEILSDLIGTDPSALDLKSDKELIADFQRALDKEKQKSIPSPSKKILPVIPSPSKKISPAIPSPSQVKQKEELKRKQEELQRQLELLRKEEEETVEEVIEPEEEEEKKELVQEDADIDEELTNIPEEEEEEKEESIEKDKIDQTLKKLMASTKIEDFGAVQKQVLQCLGMVAA